MQRAELAWVGIDVSADELVVAMQRDDRRRCRSKFPNDTRGHRALLCWIKKQAYRSRICLESTGIYSLDVALALNGDGTTELMVANPRAVSDFAKALLQRSKTDSIDANVILEFVMRMPFVHWQAPSVPKLNLRALMRRVAALKTTRTQELNRLHASSRTGELTASIRRDLNLSVRQIDRRIEKLEGEAMSIIESDADLQRRYAHLVSVKGIARVSALMLLGELVLLPSDLTARQLVAHAGLDPRHHDSGTSVHKQTRISRTGNKLLRAALFMPAMVASHCEPHIEGFYRMLIARGKTKMQALVAVMRKLLHAIHGMLRTDTDFDGAKFFSLAA